MILGISYWAVARVTRPIKHLSQAVTSLAEGHFTQTASTGREDEIGILVTGFNVMAEKLKRAYKDLEGKVEASNKELEIAYQILKERQEQLIQSEKMAALRQLSAGIAHEIRTPLTSIKIFVQSLEKEMELDENQREDFRIIRKEIERMNENISRILNFARPEEPFFQRIRIGPLVKDAINLVAPKFKHTGIRVDISLSDGDQPLEGDPNQLTQVLLNLFLNAIEAMPQGGTLIVRSNIQAIPNSRQAFLQLVIRDTGYGVSEKDRPTHWPKEKEVSHHVNHHSFHRRQPGVEGYVSDCSAGSQGEQSKATFNSGFLRWSKKTLVLIYVVAILGYAIMQPWISKPIIDYLLATGVSCQSPAR